MYVAIVVTGTFSENTIGCCVGQWILTTLHHARVYKNDVLMAVSLLHLGYTHTVHSASMEKQEDVIFLFP